MIDLLLLPGFMCDEDLWADTKIEFEKLGRIQFGDFGDGTTMEAMAEHVLSTAPLKFVLIGFSMGGYVAQEIVHKAPNRVAALILIGTSADGDAPSKTKMKRDLALMSQNRPFRGLSKVACRTSLHPEHDDPAGLVDRIQAMALRLGQGAFIRQLSVVRQDGYNRLKNIGCPTLVIAARQDQLRPVENSTQLASKVPGACLLIVEDCGHMIPMERPGQLAKIIKRWLSANTE